MKNQYNTNAKISILQYPVHGILNIFYCYIWKIKILWFRKALYFCTAKQKMILNLHIHHHHFTHRVSCDVFM